MSLGDILRQPPGWPPVIPAPAPWPVSSSPLTSLGSTRQNKSIVIVTKTDFSYQLTAIFSDPCFDEASTLLEKTDKAGN